MDKATTALESNRSLARERRLADSSFRLGMQADGDELFFAVPHKVVAKKRRRLAAAGIIALRKADEGIHSTRRQIDELLCETSESQSLSNKRFRELANLYLGLTTDAQGLPNSAEDIRAIYDKVMQGESLCENAPDGALFRRSGVEVIGNVGAWNLKERSSRR